MTDLTKHPEAAHDCKSCAGHGWALFTRSDDNALAVERCDECLGRTVEDPEFISDVDLVQFAEAAGIICQREYPCRVLCKTCKNGALYFRELAYVCPACSAAWTVEDDRRLVLADETVCGGFTADGFEGKTRWRYGDRSHIELHGIKKLNNINVDLLLDMTWAVVPGATDCGLEWYVKSRKARISGQYVYGDETGTRLARHARDMGIFKKDVEAAFTELRLTWLESDVMYSSWVKMVQALAGRLNTMLQQKLVSHVADVTAKVQETVNVLGSVETSPPKELAKTVWLKHANIFKDVPKLARRLDVE